MARKQGEGVRDHYSYEIIVFVLGDARVYSPIPGLSTPVSAEKLAIGIPRFEPIWHIMCSRVYRR